LGAEGTFVARTIDVETKHLQEMIRRAFQHKGGAFLEILQNCNVFNDGAWATLSDKETKAETQLLLEHGKPLVFGKRRDKGIRLRGLQPEVVTLGDGTTEGDLLVHDEKDLTIGFILSHLQAPKFPTPIGVFRAVQRETYDTLINSQIAQATAKGGPGDLDAVFSRGSTWTVT
jgi:2-oxoglutarate ferredoxin oxidoreductase subunit beta